MKGSAIANGIRLASSKLALSANMGEATGLVLNDHETGRDLTAPAAISAGFWTTAVGRGYFNVGTDFFERIENDMPNLFASLSTSYVFEFIYNQSGTPTGDGAVFAMRDTGGTLNGMQIDIQATGVIRQQWDTDVSTRNIIVASPGAGDHHCILTFDRVNQVRHFYLDGSLTPAETGGLSDISAYAAETSVPTSAVPCIGARSSGATQLDKLGNSKVELAHLNGYITEGALPADITDLVQWIFKHPEQVLSAEQW